MGAMYRDKLEDPMNGFWGLHSKPEDRVVGSDQRPGDEWDSVKRNRKPRHRESAPYHHHDESIRES